MKEKTIRNKAALLLIIGVIFALSLSVYTQGVPSGATTNNLSTDSGPTVTPGNQSHQGGTITTLSLTSIQQNPGWKAYFGNVTGSLTLDDSNSNTIYDWTLSTISGEVYASRDSSVGWASISCATDTTVAAEQVIIGGLDADSDSINNTYNNSNHSVMQIGVNTITANTCKSVYTFVNDTRQPTNTTGNNFTAILVQDAGNDLVYATFIQENANSFNNQQSDFQIILPDQENSTIATYYFYLELGT